MKKTFPVLIISYARPEGLERIINSALLAGITNFYIAIDGPKNFEIAQSQVLMEEFLLKISSDKKLNLKIWKRDKNLGAACSVLTAINWFFASEEAGIILEDDLVPSLDFFGYSSVALDKYRDHEGVWSIAGTRLLDSSSGKSDWSVYPMIWGWATWASKWKTMYPMLTSKPSSNWYQFFSPTANFWLVGARRAQAGLIDAWDIPLAHAQMRAKKYSLIPPTNLVSNIGFDKNATHTTANRFPLNHPIESLPSNFLLPDEISPLSAGLFDISLMKEVYFLKKRHVFLRVWAYITDPLRYRSRTVSSLKEKLTQVNIPNL
jgi:hypothetical protein